VFEKTGKLRCEGKIIHAGGRIATAEGRVWDEAGTLIAHGSETCMVMTVPGMAT
jgi:acyl-coenzyme A thioesterase PaaI-like protein